MANNCLVTKLKSVVDNPNLPILKEIIVKDWATNSQNGQYINLSSILPSGNTYKFNEFLLEFELKRFKSPGNSGNIVEGRTGLHFVRYSSPNLVLQGSPSAYTLSEVANIGDSATISMNTSTGVLLVNNQQKEWGWSLENNFGSEFYLLKDADITYGSFAFGKFKVTHVPSGKVLVNMYPAIVDNVSCFFDKVTQSEVLPNTGTLTVM